MPQTHITITTKKEESPPISLRLGDDRASVPLPSADTHTLQQQLSDAQRWVKELKDENDKLMTHCHFASWVVSRQQKQLHVKATRKGTQSNVRAIKSRVLTAKDGRLEIECRHAEECLKGQQQKEDTAQKAAEEQERCERRADNSRTFAAPLNKLQ
ncbi:hypothetical protein EDB83DRAFT_2317905 [Lactarius deliciosus]|nr:hypothetical protein EDB83DRAFT_2317905 [Lactarius deliciosus]